MPIILLACGPCVVIVNCWGTFCTLGKAPRTKESLPYFHEWCRVTRHPLIFLGLTGCQRDTPILGRHKVDQGKGKLCHDKESLCRDRVGQNRENFYRDRAGHDKKFNRP